MWVFRGNFAGESSTSQNLTIDHRSACASLISLEDEGKVMTPIDIIKILFLEEELENVDSILEKFDDNEVEKLSYKVLWNSVKSIKTVEEFLALGPANRELVWDLLHLGLQRTFDTDFNLSFGYTWAQAYKEVKPNIANLALQTQLDKIKASLQVPQDPVAPSQEIPAPVQPVEETDGNPSEATGS
jgi:hypothetical protein